MDEAIPSILPQPSRGIAVLALQRAIKEVKAAIQRQGRRKLSQMPKREIVAMAEEYLAEHPELIAEAKETALRWAAKGFFGKRAALAAHVQFRNRCAAWVSSKRISCT
jgi:hypothetical protein